MSRRALRRHHLARLKKRVEPYYVGLADKFADEHDRARVIGRLVNTRAPCSCCWMCGKPRRLGERPVAERGADSAWPHDPPDRNGDPMNSELRESLQRLLSLAEESHRGARLSLRDKATLQRCRWAREDYLHWPKRSQATPQGRTPLTPSSASPEARAEARDAIEQALAYRQNSNAW